MSRASTSDDATRRLALLEDIGILNSPPDAEFDALTRAAALVCGVPISLICLLDDHRQWFKSNIGLDGFSETPLSVAFCVHTIARDDLVEVQDARADPRFESNPVVTGSPAIRFYAGIALSALDGTRIGTLCVLDRRPRHLDDTQRDVLRALAQAAQSALRNFGARQQERGTNWDVTEPHLLADALARHRDLLQTTLRSIGDAVITTDASGCVVWLNPAAERLTGWPAREAEGRPIAEVLHIVHAETRHAAPSPIAACLAQGRILSLADRTVLIARGGREYAIEDSASPIRDDQGQMLGAVLVFRDVSAQRALEDERDARGRELQRVNAELQNLAGRLARARDTAQRASRAKSRFLAGMSHELRTPLNGILGYAELLRIEGGLTPAQSARVDAMLAAGTHLVEMITSVLNLSAIEAERVALKPSRTETHTIASTCLNLVAPAARAKGLILRTSTTPDTPLSLVTDPMRLRQVLLNLLGNAVKFTREGMVELRLSAVSSRMAVRFAVVDTGPGIPLGQRARLFQDFERLDADSDSVIEGAGLGLALSARLAALLGGRLSYDDNPDGGSIFWLELPLECATASPASHEEAAAKRCARSHLRPLHVLVVDDFGMNRDIATAFLRAAGHEVRCAESGPEAIGQVARGDFDVVLMDVRMPGMDGLEATRRIRAMDQAVARVPILGVTAQAFAEQVEECLSAGMDGHLSKPYTADALVDAVEQAAATTPGRKARSYMHTATPAPGTLLPVLDLDAIERLTHLLSPEAIATYLHTIIVRSEAVSAELRAPGALSPPTGRLVDATHSLAGSAGLFGFMRLATIGLQFEKGLREGSPDTVAMAACLAAAIDATLAEIDLRRAAAVET